MIAQIYPQAFAHIAGVRGHKAEMAAAWNSALDGGLLSESVVTDPDGQGRNIGQVGWPAALQSELTAHFQDCVDALWAALDCLVTETADAFSVQHRLRNPARPRFFPVADSQDAF